MEHSFLHRYGHGDGAHTPTARQDRARPASTPLHRDGTWRRLPREGRATQVTTEGQRMRRTLAIAALTCVVGAGVVGSFAGPHGALLTLGLLLAVSAAALASAVQAKRSRARIGSLSRQLALTVGIAVGAILVAVWIAAAVMFISAEDARLVSVMAAVIAVVGMCVSSLLT